MKFTKHKIAALLALFIGVMSVIAGSRVLLGYGTPDYNVLQWLVIYNVVAGAISIIVAILIWTENSRAKSAALLIFAAHTIVLLLLISVFNEVAAVDSMKAMAFRDALWVAIIILVFKAKQDEI